MAVSEQQSKPCVKIRNKIGHLVRCNIKDTCIFHRVKDVVPKPELIRRWTQLKMALQLQWKESIATKGIASINATTSETFHAIAHLDIFIATRVSSAQCCIGVSDFSEPTQGFFTQNVTGSALHVSALNKLPEFVTEVNRFRRIVS